MGFTFMKRVDYLIGIPICFLLTICNSLVRMFPRSSQKSGAPTPTKILVIKPSEIGAIVLSYPLLKRLKLKYPQAELYFLTFKSNRELFEVFDTVSPAHVWTIEESSLMEFIKDVFKIIFKMRKEKFDTVIDLEFFSRFTTILSYFSGAIRRVGFHRFTIEGVYRGDLLTHKIQYNPYLHVTEMYLLMGDVLEKTEKKSPEYPKINTKIDMLRFQSSDNLKTVIINKLNQTGIKEKTDIYLICPGEGRIPLREWPLENFNQLITSILKQQNTCVVLIGHRDTANRAHQLVINQNQPQRCINLMGQTTIPELLTLLSMSKGLVVNDSGMAHLAALTQVKQFVLFGPETPKIFSPWGEHTTIFYTGVPCSPCLSVFNHRNSACRDNICLKSIKPDEVFAAMFHKL